MSLLKQFITEMGAAGATSAGAVAGFRGSLFGGGAMQSRYRTQAKNKNRNKKRTMAGYHYVNEAEGEPTFATSKVTKLDPADVLSKLSAAEKKAKNAKDTVTFGLEDEEGGLVKVYVKADQAEEFEKALAALLSSMDDNDDDENTPTEIAEVLFQLKDKFEIVDVEWPTIEGDEEEEQEVGSEEGDDAEMTADTGGEGDLDAAASDLEGDGDGGASEEDAKSALQQVIDMMKADAEAKKAEAEAKTAEYKAKEAEFASQAAAEKVKQEEEILDMESYYKDKQDEEKEAKQLAKLAKYKHDLAKDETSPEDVGSAEEEEKTVSVNDLASLIMKNLSK